jgi:hypothetical protein
MKVYIIFMLFINLELLLYLKFSLKFLYKPQTIYTNMYTSIHILVKWYEISWRNSEN